MSIFHPDLIKIYRPVARGVQRVRMKGQSLNNNLADDTLEHEREVWSYIGYYR